MIADTHLPLLVIDRVIYTLLACVAGAFESIASERTRRPGAVTLTNEDRIGRVAEVVYVDVRPRLMGANTVARWRWEAETISGHCVWISFESYDRQAIG